MIEAAAREEKKKGFMLKSRKTSNTGIDDSKDWWVTGVRKEIWPATVQETYWREQKQPLVVSNLLYSFTPDVEIGSRTWPGGRSRPRRVPSWRLRSRGWRKRERGRRKSWK